MPEGSAPTRIPVGVAAAMRSPRASTLSPPGGSLSRSTSVPRRIAWNAPALTVSGTAILSMRLASTSCDSMSANVAVLSTVLGSR